MKLAVPVCTCVFPFRICLTLKILPKGNGELKPTIAHYGGEETDLESA